MGGDNEVCILHTDISRGMTDLNKDVGKLSERLGRVEENTKDIPAILTAIEEIRNQRANSAGFIAGVAFAVSLLVSGVGFSLTIWFSRGH
ncbi:MAG: hypothetical protein H6Q66_282 [Firmicutes bacterium]|nr:hypothetical protein [Bacillota bacterium]